MRIKSSWPRVSKSEIGNGLASALEVAKCMRTFQLWFIDLIDALICRLR